jgi:hypothetical protein
MLSPVLRTCIGREGMAQVVSEDAEVNAAISTSCISCTRARTVPGMKAVSHVVKTEQDW